MDTVDVYACVCASSDMCVGTYMHMCALECRGARLTPRSFLNCSGSYSLRLLLSKLIDDVNWDSQLALKIPFIYLLKLRGGAPCHAQLAFLWVLGIWDTAIMYLSATQLGFVAQNWIPHDLQHSCILFSDEASASRFPEMEDELGTMYLETCILKFYVSETGRLICLNA